MQEAYDVRNPAALARITASGVQLRRFSDEVMAAARTATEALLEEQATADPRQRAIYDSWKKARDEAFAWFGTAELAYANFAFPER